MNPQAQWVLAFFTIWVLSPKSVLNDLELMLKSLKSLLNTDDPYEFPKLSSTCPSHETVQNHGYFT